MRPALMAVALFLAVATGACRPAPEPVRSTKAAETVTQSGPGCVDAWLRARGLNEYGDSAGTMYAGGTPLFNESTGRRVDRMDYLLQHHPELATACPAETGARDAGSRSP